MPNAKNEYFAKSDTHITDLQLANMLCLLLLLLHSVHAENAGEPKTRTLLGIASDIDQTPALPPLNEIPSLANNSDLNTVVQGPATDTYDDVVDAQDTVDFSNDLYLFNEDDKNETLFGSTGMPQIADIQQGIGIRSDTILGVLMALVNKYPGYIRAIIQRRGDLGYRVLLYGDGKPVWVNLDETLFLSDSGETICNNRVTFNGKIILWPHLICKAVAKLLDKFPRYINDEQEGYNNIDLLIASDVLDIMINRESRILSPKYGDTKEEIFQSVEAVNRNGIATLDVYTSSLFDGQETRRNLTAPLGTIIEEIDGSLSGIFFITPVSGEPFYITSNTQVVLRVDTATSRLRVRSPFGAGERERMQNLYISVEYWLPLNALIDLNATVTTVGNFKPPDSLQDAPANMPELQPTFGPVAPSPSDPPVPLPSDSVSFPVPPSSMISNNSGKLQHAYLVFTVFWTCSVFVVLPH